MAVNTDRKQPPRRFMYLALVGLTSFNLLLWFFVGWHPFSFITHGSEILASLEDKVEGGGHHAADAAHHHQQQQQQQQREGALVENKEAHANHQEGSSPDTKDDALELKHEEAHETAPTTTSAPPANWEAQHAEEEEHQKAKEEAQAKDLEENHLHNTDKKKHAAKRKAAGGGGKKTGNKKGNAKKKKLAAGPVVTEDAGSPGTAGLPATTPLPTVALSAMEEGPLAGDGADWPTIMEDDVGFLYIPPPSLKKGETLQPTPESELPAKKKNPEGLVWLGKKKPRVRLYTDYGSILWELEPGHAPKTVKNFLNNCEGKGYMNTSSCFYRYERGFVLQGGACGGNSGKSVPLEYSIPNQKNTIALARAGGNLNSGGSEWFINLANNSRGLGPGRKGGYAVFARVISGFNTMNKLKKLPTKGGKGSLTKFVSPPPKIRKVMIFYGDAAAKGDDAE